jgi:hypothetical protein
MIIFVHSHNLSIPDRIDQPNWVLNMVAPRRYGDIKIDIVGTSLIVLETTWDIEIFNDYVKTMETNNMKVRVIQNIKLNEKYLPKDYDQRDERNIKTISVRNMNKVACDKCTICGVECDKGMFYPYENVYRCKTCFELYDMNQNPIEGSGKRMVKSSRGL